MLQYIHDRHFTKSESYTAVIHKQLLVLACISPYRLPAAILFTRCSKAFLSKRYFLVLECCHLVALCCITSFILVPFFALSLYLTYNV
jgi:hypothetical protein